MSSLTVLLQSRADDLNRWWSGSVKPEPLKEAEARALWRIPVGSAPLIVKRFPPSAFRNRARVEAKRLQALARAGIGCPRVVGTALDTEGSYLVTEEIMGTESLGDRLRTGKGRRALLARLAGLVHRMHESGFEHGDLHGGNILVRGDEIFILDVHRAAIRSRLSQTARERNLAFLIMSFPPEVSTTERFRFLRSYGLQDRASWKRVVDAYRRELQRYYRSRDLRCISESSEYTAWDQGWRRRDISVSLMKALVARMGESIKRLPGRRVYRNDMRFVKELSPTLALRHWRNGHRLRVRGIPTPRLDAVGPGWVLGEWIEGLALWEHVKTNWPKMTLEQRRDFVHRLALRIRTLHDRGICHGDLKANNVLVTAEEFHLIDLDRVTFSRAVSDRLRRWNLAQLNAAVGAPLTKSERLYFLHRYFGRDRAKWTARKDWVREVMRLTRGRRHVWPGQG